MRFALLGPLTVIDCTGRGVVVAGLRPRVLLATLLLHANTPVPAEALAEMVWDGSPPPAAVATLRSYVKRLRRALGPVMAERVVAREPGYLIRADQPELDVLEFEALCRDAGAALRAKQWAAASAAAARASQLWRGAPLLDVPVQALRDEFVPRLERLRLQVLEDACEAGLRLGQHQELIAQLSDLTARHPLRERFHAQLMLALAGAGRQAEALETYQAARRVLGDELGTEPGPELRGLHQQILTSGGAGVTAVLGRGEGAPRQLPAMVGHFTGRRCELEMLADMPSGGKAEGGTVVISAIDGMAGIGKTALAVHAAHRLSGKFPDGQLFIDLHGYTEGREPRTPGDALERLLRALDVPLGQIPQDTEERAALYRQRLAGTRTLILLDNAGSETQVRPLLPGSAGCLVLVTSRRRLKGLDDARVVSLGVLPESDAIALLRAVADRGRVLGDDSALGKIAELCGHLPLALRIAATLLRHRPAWTPGYLAGVLADRHQRIAALSDGERDLSAAFALSYRSLSPARQRFFRGLGLIPGPDTDAAAAAALTGTDPTTATRLLEDLVDHNLLIQQVPGRYVLHDLVRLHARTLADQDPLEDRQLQ